MANISLRGRDFLKLLDFTPAEIKYLLDLARTNGVTPQQILTRFKVNSLEELTRNQCSMAIDEFNGKAA